MYLFLCYLFDSVRSFVRYCFLYVPYLCMVYICLYFVSYFFIYFSLFVSFALSFGSSLFISVYMLFILF